MSTATNLAIAASLGVVAYAYLRSQQTVQDVTKLAKQLQTPPPPDAPFDGGTSATITSSYTLIDTDDDKDTDPVVYSAAPPPEPVDTAQVEAERQEAVRLSQITNWTMDLSEDD